jgi:hypothetical protein
MTEVSFSSKVKREIADVFGDNRHCRIASLSAIIYLTGEIDETCGEPRLSLKSENEYIAKQFRTIIQKDFNGLADVKILRAAGFVADDGTIQRRLNRLVVRNLCCKRAYLRTLFLCAGTVNGLGKAYHLEISVSDENYRDGLDGLFVSFGLTPKYMTRNGRGVIYLKESEQIADFLNVIHAHRSLLEFEDKRTVKDVGNSINRRANFEAANADKSISAAVRQIEDILIIEQKMGLAALPPSLLEFSELRKVNPEMSLTEIGSLMNPPIGKSGVNHRIRKIAEIAEDLKN